MTIFDKILIIQISADTVAWYAAIVATISVIIAFLNYIRDRGKIRVRLSQGLLDHGGRLGDTQILIEAINSGRRNVTLTGAGLSLDNGSSIIVMDRVFQFPHELREGKSILVWMDKKYIFQKAFQEKTKITHGWYKDATGKIYKAKFNIRND